MPVSSVTEHWIKQDAITINLNHFGDPDYLQVSVLAGAVVMAFKQDVIGYNAAHNYRTWPLQAANTYLESTSEVNVYARLTRSEVNASALVVYDTVLRDIEGRDISNEEGGNLSNSALGNPDPDYFFVYLGKISGSLSESGLPVSREWLVEFRFGNLATNQFQNEEAGGEWTKMFRLNKVTDLIDVLKTFSNAVFKKLSIKRNDKEKLIVDVKRSIDNDDEVPVSDDVIPSAKYLHSVTEERFLRKDQDDRSVGTVASDKGFVVGDFNEGTLGSGAAIFEREGNTFGEVDFLKVRKKATFTEITVQELKHVGGEIILSPAAMICSRVEESENGWKCYFNAEDSEGRKVYQEFEPNDLARCQTFNLSPKGANDLAGNHYYWRKVVSVGDDYIELSKAECDAQSDAPQVGDNISQLGNTSNTERQAAIILSAFGSDAPSYKQYNGIDGFSLVGKQVTKLSPYGNELTGRLNIEAGSKGAGNLEDFPEEIFKAVHVGSVNLLFNSGFTGDYKSEDLDASYALSDKSELFSRGMKHWTGKATINDDAASVSGKSATIGSLSQSVQLMKDEGYVVSFKAKGASVKVILGGASVENELTSEYTSYSFKFTSDGIGTFSISGDATICDLQLERGTIATDWHASPYDNDRTLAEFQALKYIQDAIREGDTTILGGLILSSMIQLGNYKDGKMEKVNAGMSGIYNDNDDVAFWGGGTFEQATATVMKFKQTPNYQPPDAEWTDFANFVVSHGGDLFLRGTIFADKGYFRGRLEAKEGVLGGFTITENDIHAEGSEITAVKQEMTLYKDGLKFMFTGGTNGEAFFGARGMELSSDQHFVHSIFIKNNAVLQWPMCGIRMAMQPTDLGLYIEGGSTHILSSGQTMINGLTLNQVVVESDMTLPMNADSVVFNNTEEVTVNLPSSRVGKVLYLKRINAGKVVLKGNIRPHNSRDVILSHSYELGDSSIMLILQGLGWTVFYCG